MNTYNTEWIREELAKGVCKVIFRKKTTGELREMKATTCPALVVPYESKTGATKVKAPNIISVWDVDIEQWRSFDVDTVESFADSSEVDQYE